MSLRLLALLLVLGLSACIDENLPGGEDRNPSQPPAADEVSISPAREQLTLWRLDEPVVLAVTVYDGQGKALEPPPALTWSSSDESVVRVDEQGRLVAVAEGEAVVVVSAKGASSRITVVVDTSVSEIGGVVRYQDRRYDERGFLSLTVYNPLRHAAYEILDADDDTVVASGYTDAQGRYRFTGSPGGRYRIRLLSKSDPAGYGVEITDLAGDLYALNLALDPAAADISIPQSSGLAGVFNILDVMLTGMEFFAELGAASLPQLKVFWARGNSLGTYYCTGFDAASCPGGAGIYVYDEPGYGGDTDEFDDDVLWHEFGHFIVDHLSADDSPGGCHLLESPDLDLRLAWSEGWGDFLPTAIKRWLAADAARLERLSQSADKPLTLYVDTAGNQARISADMNDASPRYRYASNEVAVARILWRLSDEFGMDKVWRVMTDYFPSLPTPTNLEGFWDGWLALHGAAGETAQRGRQILAAQQVYYQADVLEPNDDQPADRTYAVDGSGELLHLYREDGVDDRDVIAFPVIAGRSYRVETRDLSNGADTFLRVRDAAGVTIASNDDVAGRAYYRYDCGETRARNDASSLASRVEFTATRSGTYEAVVSTTPDPDPYPEAGRYGSYRLVVEVQ